MRTASEPTDARPRSLATLLHTGILAWIVLGFSLAITFVAWRLAENFAQQRVEERFHFEVDETQRAIHRRLTDYELVLRGGIGLFQANRNVNRQQWEKYVTSLRVASNYPGIQGIGFSKWIRPRELSDHVREVRSEGFPEYTVRPSGIRDQYSAILFLEPFDWRNRRAFGFDMFSERTRGAAMSMARDTGETAMSGKVTLVQETGQDIQSGFLMYLPLYREGANISTVEARREALEGFVYGPFRIGDLMAGILNKESPEIDFEIFDGSDIVSDALLYASTLKSHFDESDMPARFFTTRPMMFGGHTWTISYKNNTSLHAATDSSQPLIVAIGGVTIDLLLFYIIVSMTRLREQAERLAEQRQVRLLASEGEFKAITDSALEGIISMSGEGRITYVNPAVEKMFGYARDELEGQSIATLLASDGRERIETLLRSERAPVQAVEFGGLRRDATVFPLELSLSVWTVGGENRASAVARDITEQKRIERMKNEFVSTVSHELRTPLTSIRGSLGLISGGVIPDMDEKTRLLVAIADNNAQRLARLIDEILDIQKIESGYVDFKFGEYAIDTLVHASVDLNMAFASQCGVTIKVADTSSVTVRVDPDRFQQVMANLIGNAVKHSSANGTVTVSIFAVNGNVRVEVRDRGEGIPEEFHARLFQKFVQVDGSDTRRTGGTGLGLSISKAIVEGFGGEINFVSSAQDGTVFYFLLPIVNRERVRER